MSIDDTIKRATFIAEKTISDFFDRAEKLKADSKKVIREKLQECRACFYIKGPRIGGRAFANYTCEVCKEKKTHSNTAIPLLCEDCGKTHDICTRCKSKMTV